MDFFDIFSKSFEYFFIHTTLYCHYLTFWPLAATPTAMLFFFLLATGLIFSPTSSYNYRNAIKYQHFTHSKPNGIYITKIEFSSFSSSSSFFLFYFSHIFFSFYFYAGMHTTQVHQSLVVSEERVIPT